MQIEGFVGWNAGSEGGGSGNQFCFPMEIQVLGKSILSRCDDSQGEGNGPALTSPSVSSLAIVNLCGWAGGQSMLLPAWRKGLNLALLTNF